MKKLILLALLIILSALLPNKIYSAENLLNYPNNKFGIHLALPAYEDLQKAADLVNSTSGDWGYVTLVMHDNDLNKEKWQGVFDKMRELRLIPILRLATSLENGYWRTPQPQEAQKWADFLNSLNWVVKNRYVVLFNETNRADEWGGQVNPQGFAKVMVDFSRALKEKNQDFFVMMAGFDSAAPSKLPQYEDEANFLRKALVAEPDLFASLDGWASHSYPKSYLNYGRNSQFNYQWELSFLKNLGVKKDLPVFITETGWSHREGITPDFNFPPQETVANLTQNYFSQLVKDPQVMTFTPFVLNYPQEPFDHYSWQKNNKAEFYPQYETVREMNKIKGQPVQEEKITILSQLPTKLIKDSTYQLGLVIRNDGQGIWEAKDGYQLILEGLPQDTDYFFSDFSRLAPFEEKTVWLHLKTGGKIEKLKTQIVLIKNNQKLTQAEWNLEIVQETTIEIIAKLLFKRKASGDDFKFLIYNNQQEVVYGVNRFEMKNGKAEIKGIKNLIIGEPYRLVLIKPFYLPRQTFLVIEEKDNQASFKILLPFDFNQDGKFSWSDLWWFVAHDPDK